MENSIGPKIKQARANLGITQKKLSKVLGCTEIMISRYELGVSQISISQLRKIAKALKQPLSYFIVDEKSDTSTTSASAEFKKAFVFDLDDTLVDGRKFCGETVARVITNVDRSVNFDLVCQLHENMRGMTVGDLYKNILSQLSIKAEIDDLLKQDYVIQEENVEKMQLFDGVVEILEFLKNNNKKIYICTNRKKDLLIKVLEANKIFSYFDEIISCVDTGYKKPNPYCLIDLVKRSGLNINDFIYFGDSEIDAQFAQNAGIDNIIFDQYLNNKNIFKKLINMFLENQINNMAI
ncbi:HAD-IA family hydrolase [Candidatus Dojkabacteria bacterium]|nr:HAD-IA family hydrolase [Candidatus Dojkabacteria bacterium]